MVSMTQLYPTELAKTLGNNDDLQKDSPAKSLFQLNEVLAWLLQTIFPCCSRLKISTIVKRYLATADKQFGTVPVEQNVRPRIRNIGSEDKSVTDGTVCYDLRTELPIPHTPPEPNMVIFNLEMQKNYKGDFISDKRMIFYKCRLVCGQPGMLTHGRVNYKKLAPVVTCWIFPNAPKWMANTISTLSLHETFVQNTVAQKHHRRKSRRGYDFAQVWKFCLNDDVPPPPGQNVLWLLYVLLTRRMSSEEKLKILVEDFGMKATEEVKKVSGFTDFIKNEGKKEWKAEGKAEGWEESQLNTYNNMKEKFDEATICECLGITHAKLRQLKKLCLNKTFQEKTV